MILEASDLRIMYGRENAPMYTNKTKGLPNYDVLRTTRVAFGILPSLNFFGGSDYDSDGGGDSGNDGGDEAGPSRRCRRRRIMGKCGASSSSSSGDNTVTVYYTNQIDEANRRNGNLVIREPEERKQNEEGRNRAASMEVDQPFEARRSSSEIRRVKGKQKVGEIEIPEEFPRVTLKPKQTTHFKISIRNKFRHAKGHVEPQDSSLMSSSRTNKLGVSRSFKKGSEKSLAFIGPKMRRLIEKLPKPFVSPPNNPSPIENCSKEDSPYFSEPNDLKKPSSSSNTPPSGMRSFPSGGPVLSQGAMHPTSNSYSPAHEEIQVGEGNTNGSLGPVPGESWQNDPSTL